MFFYLEVPYQEASGLYRNQEKPQEALLSWIIQQHLDRLNSEQKQFLTNLSVYRLPFNREAASYILIDKEIKTRVIKNKLKELCNRSLLIKTQDNKFQFESLVQKYVLQQANDLTKAHLQAIEYYRLYLKDEKLWQVLDDVSEYLEIVYHQCELKQYYLANNVLNVCADFLYMKGYYLALKDIYKKLISRWQQNVELEEYNSFASALGQLGNTYYSLGKIKKAIQYYQQSLDIRQDIGSLYGEANSLNNLGIVYHVLGDYKRAIEFYQQSLDIKQAIGDRHGEANSWFNLGDTRKKIQQKSEAKTAYENARKLYQAMGLDKKVENCHGAIKDLENDDIKLD